MNQQTIPYITNQPVNPANAFIGRNEILQRVQQMVVNTHENALLLYGQRRIGKTSLLHTLKDQLSDASAQQAFYFDLQDRSAQPLGELLQELAFQLANHFGVAAFDDTTQTLTHSFRTAFLPGFLSQLPVNKPLVLLFDEFDVHDKFSPQFIENRQVSPAMFADSTPAGVAFYAYMRDLMGMFPRMKFVFAIGRRPEDYFNLTLSIFQGFPITHISLLSEEETTTLIRLSDRRYTRQSSHRQLTLAWPDETAAYIYTLAGGHPLLTQTLCQQLCEIMRDDAPLSLLEPAPVVEKSRVDDVVGVTLSHATDALEWLWQGLEPAERIIAAILAESDTTVRQVELEQTLNERGIRILPDELRHAPLVLRDWGFIKEGDASNEGGYIFPVALLQRWIAERKPVSQVQEEFDDLQAAAGNFYQTASTLHFQEANENTQEPFTTLANIDPQQMPSTQDLALLYEQALKALRDNQSMLAVRLLTHIISIDPFYREATRYLHIAVHGADVAGAELHGSSGSIKDLTQRIESLEKTLTGQSIAGQSLVGHSHRLLGADPKRRIDDSYHVSPKPTRHGAPVSQIALWGPAQVGMSSYLAGVMLALLESEPLGWTWRAVHDEQGIAEFSNATSAYIRYAMTKLADGLDSSGEGGLGHTAPTTKKPTRFHFDFDQQGHWLGRRGRYHRATFIDVEGTFVDDGSDMQLDLNADDDNGINQAYFETLCSSDGILMMVDPNVKYGQVVYEHQAESGNPNMHLGTLSGRATKLAYFNLVDLLIEYVHQTRPPGTTIDIPVAICLTKMDQPIHWPYREQPQEYLRDVLGKATVNRIHSIFRNCRYFSISVVGQYQDPSTGQITSNLNENGESLLDRNAWTPYNILDPLFWLFDQFERQRDARLSFGRRWFRQWLREANYKS